MLRITKNDMKSHGNTPIEAHVCPYWLDATKSCLISKQGLYLPVTEHILTYCRTGNHLFCAQFEQQVAGLPEHQNGSAKVVDRRQRKESDRRESARIFGSHSLQLTEIQDGDSPPSSLDKNATTIDLSAGGIRLQTHCELPVDSMVSFSMNGASGPPVQGIGRIKWCRPMEDGSVYQAGLVFTDGSTSGAMRRYLDSSPT